MGMCFASEGIKLLQLRKFLYHIYSLPQLLYVFHCIAPSLFQEISCSIHIHLWLLLQVMYITLYLSVIQLERQRRMKGLPAVDKKPKHVSADDLGDR